MSQASSAAIYKQLFTDAEWQIIDYALSEYKDHLFEDDNEIAIYESIQAKLNAIFTLTANDWVYQNLPTFLWTF